MSFGEKESQTKPKFFRARYTGYCYGCNEGIEQGDWICYIDDDIHCQECGEEVGAVW